MVAGRNQEALMRHDEDLASQDVEEVAEDIWTLNEEGHHDLAHLRGASRVPQLERTLGRMARWDLVRLLGEAVSLTPRGEELAERQVRRHRLAEMLFTTVLEVRDEQAVDRTACVIEHVLDANLTDSVCAFIGHPRVCPHGKPIPPGACCRSLSRPSEPLVQPLCRLAPGESGRIVHIVPRDPRRLGRLASLGVVPGATVRLQQKSPAVVMRVGETTLAVEPEFADEIYVKKGTVAEH
jgi:DtxR family transcriptional regulator, Mn-dependent transcriptional regulator